MSYTSTILAESSLVNYWQLNDVAATAPDSKGTYTGTYTNSPSPGTGRAVSGYACRFFGTKSSYVIASPSSTLDAPFSVEFWFRTVSGSSAQMFGTRSGGAYVDIQISNTTGIHCDLGNGSTFLNTSANGTAGSSFADNNWHHLVLTVSTTTYIIYLDGVSIGTGSVGGTARLWSSSTTVRFGDGGNSSFFTGFLDEVAVYNAVLSSGQVSTHYAASQIFPVTSLTKFPVFPATPRMQWGHSRANGIISAFPFVGQILNKAASNGWKYDLARGLKLIAAGTFPLVSDLPGSVWENGTGNGVFNQSSGSVAVYNTPILTIASLIKTSISNAVLQIATRDNTNTNRSWQFRIDNGYLNFLPFLSSTPNTTIYGATNIADGLWHHVAVVSDGINVILYVDGQEDACRSYPNNIDSVTVQLSIGNTGQLFNDSPWQGRMADFKFWGRALSSSEISAEVANPWTIYQTRPRNWMLAVVNGGLFLPNPMTGLGSGGPNFANPLG